MVKSLDAADRGGVMEKFTIPQSMIGAEFFAAATADFLSSRRVLTTEQRAAIRALADRLTKILPGETPASDVQILLLLAVLQALDIPFEMDDEEPLLVQ